MTVTAMPKNAPATGEEAPAKSKKKLIVIAVAVLALLGGAYWFFLAPSEDGKAEPVPGEVVKLDSIQVNLAAGHYLRLGIALQTVEGSGGHGGGVDGSKALDAAIGIFSNLPISAISQPVQREKLRDKLEHELEERYHHEVMGVYFTEFVTQ